MGGCFYIALNMSITATLIGLLVLIVRAASGIRLPAQARYALWGLVGLRLLLPFSIPSRASFFNLLDGSSAGPASVPAGNSGLTLLNSVKAADARLPVQFRSDDARNLFNALGWAWIAGAALLLLAWALLYALAASKLRRAIPCEAGGLPLECSPPAHVRRRLILYSSATVDAPCVFGVLRPRVVIPPALAVDVDPSTLRYALLHECAHIRRGDNALKLLSLLFLCVNWFNPFIWLFFMLSGRDMELACDASVLKRLTADERRGYALALMKLAAGRQPLLAAAFGRSAVKERILGITRYKRITLAMGILAFLCLLALAASLLTNPV